MIAELLPNFWQRRCPLRLLYQEKLFQNSEFWTLNVALHSTLSALGVYLHELLSDFDLNWNTNTLFGNGLDSTTSEPLHPVLNKFLIFWRKRKLCFFFLIAIHEPLSWFQFWKKPRRKSLARRSRSTPGESLTNGTAVLTIWKIRKTNHRNQG